ncbi:MAG: GspH/FimT family pseudopilin [Vicinamibacterales bacterium]
MKANRERGFTLIEMMVTVSIAAVLLALAIPNMGVFVRNNRLTSAANDILHSLQLARTEAVKRGVNVVMCGTSNPDASDSAIACTNTLTGWFVFVDDNGNWSHDSGEAVLQKRALVNSTVTVKADGDYRESYAPTGFANTAGTKNPTYNVVFCDSRGNAALNTAGTVTYSAARGVVIATTGRAVVTNVKTDSGSTSRPTVTKTLTNIGAGTTCP